MRYNILRREYRNGRDAGDALALNRQPLRPASVEEAYRAAVEETYARMARCGEDISGCGSYDGRWAVMYMPGYAVRLWVEETA